MERRQLLVLILAVVVLVIVAYVVAGRKPVASLDESESSYEEKLRIVNEVSASSEEMSHDESAEAKALESIRAAAQESGNGEAPAPLTDEEKRAIIDSL